MREQKTEKGPGPETNTLYAHTHHQRPVFIQFLLLNIFKVFVTPSQTHINKINIFVWKNYFNIEIEINWFRLIFFLYIFVIFGLNGVRPREQHTFFYAPLFDDDDNAIGMVLFLLLTNYFTSVYGLCVYSIWESFYYNSHMDQSFCLKDAYFY